MKGKTKVRPYKRKNKKKYGTHKVKGHTRNKSSKSQAGRVADAYVNDEMSYANMKINQLLSPIKKRIEESGGDVDKWNFELGIATCPHNTMVYDCSKYEQIDECEHGCHKMVKKKKRKSNTKLGDLF